MRGPGQDPGALFHPPPSPGMSTLSTHPINSLFQKNPSCDHPGKPLLSRGPVAAGMEFAESSGQPPLSPPSSAAPDARFGNAGRPSTGRIPDPSAASCRKGRMKRLFRRGGHGRTRQRRERMIFFQSVKIIDTNRDRVFREYRERHRQEGGNARRIMLIEAWGIIESIT